MNENTKQKIIEARVYRKLYQGFFERKVNGVVVKTNRVDEISPNLQAVHTPYELCYDMVAKLCENSGSLAGKEILVFNLEFAEVLLYDEVGFGAEASRITFVTDCLEKFTFSRVGRYAGIKRFFKSFDDIKKLELNMKFDVVIMNPPYQTKSENKGSGHTLWDKFVEKSMSITNPDGFLASVNPAGWRRPSGSFVKIGKAMKENQICYLEIHNIDDGLKTFGVCTRYDWYVMQNKLSTTKTQIVSEDGKQSDVDISKLSCIPNGEFEAISRLLSNDPKNMIKVINDRSNYGADKKHLSKTQDSVSKYPCIYSLPQKGMQLMWSSRNDRGHFGIPKVIFSNGACPQVIIDEDGQYGLTQWAFGIVDKAENLKYIQKALLSEKFINLCKYMRFTLDKYDINFISNFRQDFWKEFI